MWNVIVLIILTAGPIRIDLSSNPPEGCNGFILRRETHFPYKDTASRESIRALRGHLRSRRLKSILKATLVNERGGLLEAIVEAQMLLKICP